jgi:small basic protein
VWLAVLGLILGLAMGYVSPFDIPLGYAKYLSVGVLAALDSVLGGIRASQEENFDMQVFLTGFFTNMLLAAILAYIGDRIGMDLYLAAVVVFGTRLFQNLAVIRRHLMKK